MWCLGNYARNPLYEGELDMLTGTEGLIAPPVGYCPKCGRTLSPWPLARPGGCAPKDWVGCINNKVQPVTCPPTKRKGGTA